MKKYTPYLFIFLVAGLITFVFIHSHSSRKRVSLITVSPAYRQYVQAFSSGIFSTTESIKVRLTDDFADSLKINTPLEETYFRITPAIKGKTFWSDTRTLEFQPDEQLPQDKIFTVEFLLSKIIRVPDSLKTMVFQFQTMKQDYDVTIENHKAYRPNDLTKEHLYGTIRTADFAKDADIEKILEATQNGSDLKITWVHESRKREHTFQVDSVLRSNKAGEVRLKWSGSPIDADKSGETKIEIPSLLDFKYTGIRVVPSSEQSIIVQFSDPLSPEQNLTGLFRIGKSNNLRYSIDDNELRIYLPERSENSDPGMKLILESSIRNINRKELNKRIIEKIQVENLCPGVRFVSDGVILPSSSGMLLPFEAVNLKAVDIKVVRIFESNILHFLQTNDLTGTSELARVGRVVLKKTIPLNGVSDYGKWNRFSMDLSSLIKPEPGAIYSISLRFKRKYSTFPCAGSDTLKSFYSGMTYLDDPETDNEKELQYYSSYSDDDEENGGWRNYRWDERGDPCKPSYYYNKSVSRNVLASDLGIIAKAGSNGNYHLFVTDIITTKSLSGVALEFFNFQLQSMAKAVTDEDGMAVVPLKKRPYILVAKKGKQTGYLKLTEGTALSLSMFDVSGEPVQQGIKGFIYGERGVWRPGDSLFLSFILEDKMKQLPEHHPVSFSLINPSGQLVTRMVRTSSLNGFYNFSTATSPDAPTGNWQAKVMVGGVAFQKTLKIETVKPNRLKINMDFRTDKLIRDKIPPVTLEASWLTGAIARNLKARVELTLSKSVTSFPKYPGYTFDNPYLGFSAENITIFEGRLDAGGKSLIVPQIHLTNRAPGVLKASFETTVFEDGGDFSIDRFSLPFYPYKSYAGLSVPKASSGDRVLYTDKSYPISLLNLSPEGALVPSNRLKVELYKLEWRWWWDDSEEGSAEFISTSHMRPVDSLTVQTMNGAATYDFRVEYEEWGRYLIKVTDNQSGHAAAKVVYVDWPGYFRIPGGEKQAASMLTFTADKEKYPVGGIVKLTLPTSPEGRALVSIENGSRVLKSFWAPTQKGSTDITFTVTEDMAPNCFASITLIQPHAQTKNDLPIRLYGVIPIFVENPATHLKPLIQMKNELAPGQGASITVKETNGKPMTYTLAVVDDGLLDLTRFKTPDPWSVFYAREALGVKTWDLFDQVIGAFSGELQRILSIGGDESGNIKKNLKANRFKPMVRFFGPFELKKGQSRTTTFTMPQYVGSVRVMVVAGHEGAYGCEEKTIPVKKPLMVMATLPRVAGPGETVVLPVSVFAMDKTIRNVTVNLEANEMFTVVGGAQRQVTFTGIGDKLVMFNLKAKEMIGMGKVKIIAVSGKERGEHAIELDIRNPNLPVTDVMEKVVQPGSTWNAEYMPVGIPGTNTGVIELSSIPPLNLEKRLEFLIHYPYGCIEQTTSSAFPQLYLSDIMELSAENKQKTEQNIRATINRLKSFQLANGGLSYWPGSQYADDWGTCYAGHFLLEAEQKGFALPIGFLGPWKEFQRQKAVSWGYNASWYNDDLMQAYRLYTLALAKAPELGAMNKLMEQKNLSVSARWQLAAAYQLAGKNEAASRLIASATTTVAPYRELWHSYGSDVRDKAMIVEALCLLNMKTKAAPLVKEIAGLMCSTEWYSTQTTAYALLAITRFSGGTSGAGIKATCQHNTDKPATVESKKPVITWPVDPKPGRKGTAKVTNNGKNILFARLVLRGTPAQGDATEAYNNLKMRVVYKSMKGSLLTTLSIPQGTSFVAEITVTNPGLRGDYKQMALSQVFPSGWEIINSRNSELAQASTAASPYDYQDVRDDRVYTYFDIRPNQSKTFRVMLMATYMGRFYLPATSCEAMYDNSISARVPGRWVEVLPAEK